MRRMLIGLAMSAASAVSAAGQVSLDLKGMRRVATIDERYQSYNVEMAEVIGGDFWKPYDPNAKPVPPPKTASAGGFVIGGSDPAMFQKMPPIDLTRPRLRKLAAALGPAYVRVSGTWANSAYFHDSDAPPPATPPKGFTGILTRRGWKGVVDFARAVDAKIVTSFAISAGVRDAQGAWTPDQARKLVAYTKSLGGEIFEFYERLRDRFQAGKPMWLTETGDAACGGNPWAATLLDTFRYVDQLARLAKRGLAVHMHNTLAVSEYGLLDAKTLVPRPNYWAALLWRRLMGPIVLDAGPSREGLHLYAHCLRGRPGGVAILAVNNSRTRTEAVDVALPMTRYTLSAHDPHDRVVQLNGDDLKVTPDGDVPDLRGAAVPPGTLNLPPASITFLAVTEAGNGNCK